LAIEIGHAAPAIERKRVKTNALRAFVSKAFVGFTMGNCIHALNFFLLFVIYYYLFIIVIFSTGNACGKIISKYAAIHVGDVAVGWRHAAGIAE
jgi:hypothetical protein